MKLGTPRKIEMHDSLHGFKRLQVNIEKDIIALNLNLTSPPLQALQQLFLSFVTFHYWHNMAAKV